MLSIIVNNKTLKELVKYVTCNLTVNKVNLSTIDKAYIVNVTSPYQSQSTECPRCPSIPNTECYATNFSLNTAHKENLLSPPFCF